MKITPTLFATAYLFLLLIAALMLILEPAFLLNWHTHLFQGKQSHFRTIKGSFEICFISIAVLGVITAFLRIPLALKAALVVFSLWVLAFTFGLTAIP